MSICKKKKDFVIFSYCKRALRVLKSNFSQINYLRSLPALAHRQQHLFLDNFLLFIDNNIIARCKWKKKQMKIVGKKKYIAEILIVQNIWQIDKKQMENGVYINSI